MSLQGYFKITRPANAFVAGLAAVIAYLIATGTVTPASLLLVVVVALITAAGNVINDYFDAEIDAVNRSDRPIPSGQVPRTAALWYSLLLFLAGIAVSLLTTPLCIGIAVINSILLIAYAARLKATPLFGNVAVAYLSGSMFLFGGAFAGVTGLVHMVPVALMTFLAMMVRELLKDAEDVDGDAACGASTLPIRIGIRRTSRIAFVFAVLAAIASFIPYAWWGAWYIAGILVVDAVLIGAAARALSCETPACMRDSKASSFLKYGMFASLLVFTLSAIFLK
ncbi:geranylgeranylglycerol-phosphate geranylgeranyltransferase [uncultured Methanoregula sp.]|uniref:geranylgeranylglycerol-phosphate geranylgeranyltransferase n=1 Tax=uncultured Methanoregula sp. TaxID=1005933 RepID=UPI002AAB2836|nr:geranylgeranylglycerol-phosphate geranylgeranyltransferase [uncultured Methanoregula sp.]